ncbi:hypothetical protein GGTG_14424 [Gaeumannomyces tritici R3-111a-1]|uniref:Uncharacterized protein n=1 Tax=Gaeumannomyces tritici (strain R3-111a-1) TaxID=644352 RepID=J3PLF5_GAET3|nr:hypothetical protein GGTG_14424 [Gaeumannomyces tritici R3-111a-1]EJT67999.1 hypothetical protein GGTG_14424 [Gaeumannomyces tritici R3-111a-1]
MVWKPAQSSGPSGLSAQPRQGVTRTRRPTRSRVQPGPAASTVPQASEKRGLSNDTSGYRCCRMKTSRWLSAAARIRSSSWPGPGRGLGHRPQLERVVDRARLATLVFERENVRHGGLLSVDLAGWHVVVVVVVVELSPSAA